MNTGLLTVIVVMAAGTTFGLWRRRSSGRFRAAPAFAFSADDLGGALGERATLVQFSSAFCAPCRGTRQTLERVAGMVSGVSYREIDAEQHLDLTRELHILRTPTVLILDASGAVKHRAAGQPRFADVIAALGQVIPEDLQQTA
jgi:thiol-disulfide isomerase/thioredoxin